MKKEIFRSYETIQPDAEAKERMLTNILAAASDIPDTRKDFYTMKKQKKTHKFQLAAALALVVVIPAAAAYATDLFGLRSISMGKITVEDPLSDVTEQEVDIISLQGISDSPESKACMEWTEFYDEYDKDGSILSEIGNGPTGVGQNYSEAYNCYTQEMVDKVDEICEKYQLSILEDITVGTYEEICEKTEIGRICNAQAKDVYHSNYSGYCYKDGTFHLEGDAFINDGDSSYTVGYQLMRTMKGSFCPYLLNIGNVDDYEQWEYNTANGVTMLLAISDFKALIIEEKEESCIVVNILNDTGEDTLDISHEALEKLAESFDFSAVR